jgi:hypothetical protein
MEPTFFATPDDVRAWLDEHHSSRDELLVGFHKKGSGRPSVAVVVDAPATSASPETRERRLDRLIADSAAGRTVPPLTRPTRGGAG